MRALRQRVLRNYSVWLRPQSWSSPHRAAAPRGISRGKSVQPARQARDDVLTRTRGATRNVRRVRQTRTTTRNLTGDGNEKDAIRITSNLTRSRRGRLL